MQATLTEFQAALLWSTLNVLSRERYEAVLKVFGSLAAAAPLVDEEFLRRLGCKEETVLGALNRLEEFDPVKEEEHLKKRGIRFLMLTDEEYPAMLYEIGDAPPFLYLQGDIRILDQTCIGLVGTREMSAYGRRVAEEFVDPLVRAGVVTVSGLAHGIDSVVAERTLKAGGRTVAVLGHGLQGIYPPANAKLAERIVKAGGLLISEYPMKLEPGKYTFPARNRIIAGLCSATVVLEAPEGSGAIITADLALEYSRDVFAVPGPIFDGHYAGCHALIAGNRAHLAASAGDVLRLLNIVDRGADAVPLPLFAPQGEDEDITYRMLTAMPQRIDALVEKTGLDAARVSSALTMMELAGGARNLGGGMWVRG